MLLSPPYHASINQPPANPPKRPVQPVAPHVATAAPLPSPREDAGMAICAAFERQRYASSEIVPLGRVRAQLQRTTRCCALPRDAASRPPPTFAIVCRPLIFADPPLPCQRHAAFQFFFFTQRFFFAAATMLIFHQLAAAAQAADAADDTIFADAHYAARHAITPFFFRWLTPAPLPAEPPPPMPLMPGCFEGLLSH